MGFDNFHEKLTRAQLIALVHLAHVAAAPDRLHHRQAINGSPDGELLQIRLMTREMAALTRGRDLENANLGLERLLLFRDALEQLRIASRGLLNIQFQQIAFDLRENFHGLRVQPGLLHVGFGLAQRLLQSLPFDGLLRLALQNVGVGLLNQIDHIVDMVRGELPINGRDLLALPHKSPGFDQRQQHQAI